MKLKPDLHAFYQSKNLFPIPEAEVSHTLPQFIQGTGPNQKIGILLIHGFTSTPACFRPTKELLEPYGFTISIPRLKGHGTHPEDMSKSTHNDWYHDVEEAYKTLGTCCDHIYVIAQSLGAALALTLAVNQPKIEKLFLLAPAVYKPFALKAAPYLRAILSPLPIKYLKSLGGDINKTGAYEFVYQKIPVNIFAQLAKSMDTARTLAPKVTVPVRIFLAKDDHVVPKANGQTLLNLIGSTDKQLDMVDHSYHVLSVDNDIEWITQQIIDDISNLH